MEAFAESILSDAPMAIIALDEAGFVCCANATADRFFGRPLSPPNAAAISDLIEGFDRAALQSPTWVEDLNARARNAGEDPLWRARRHDGVHAFVDVQAARFSARNGKFVTLFIQDMTTAVTAETALLEVKLQIIHNWRLSSLGEMASMVAHEVNQPLSAAINYLAAAETAVKKPGPNTANAPELMAAARAQVKRAADIILRLRALMIHEKRYQAREQVAEVIEEIMPILVSHARETKAEISSRIDPAAYTYCDRVQLQQVILNLARNAMEAPPNDVPRRVEISGRQTSQGYQILVSDNGPGVPADMAGKLFDPLVSSKSGGMGLGLSICRTIVEAHGGVIELVPSALGGAGFAFTLNANVHDLSTQGDASGGRKRPKLNPGVAETDDWDRVRAQFVNADEYGCDSLEANRHRG